MLLGSVGTAIPSPPLFKLSPSIPPSTSSTTSLTLKPCNSIKKPWISFVFKRSDSEPHISYWKKKGSSKTHDGSWEEEEPDDEMVSYEEEEEDEEQQDDWGEEPEPEEINQVKESKHTPYVRIADVERARYLEDIRKEVEQLLEPEERAILEQTKAPVFSKISTAKWQPLQTLALSGQIYFMDKLIEQGVHIDAVDKDGFTALHKAVIGKKEPVISHLLRKGANPHVLDRDGATPLHYAVQVGAFLIVKLLIKYKVDLNVADNEGWTPLHVAIQSRNRDIVKILLVNGADKTRRTKEGKLALDLAICYGKDFKSYDLAKLLKVLPVNSDP